MTTNPVDLDSYHAGYQAGQADAAASRVRSLAAASFIVWTGCDCSTRPRVPGVQVLGMLGEEVAQRAAVPADPAQDGSGPVPGGAGTPEAVPGRLGRSQGREDAGVLAAHAEQSLVLSSVVDLSSGPVVPDLSKSRRLVVAECEAEFQSGASVVTPEQAAEWAALAEAATPGPWLPEPSSAGEGWSRVEVSFGPQDNFERVGCMLDDHENAEADQAFIAAAREAVPVLLADREWLLAEVQRLRAEQGKRVEAVRCWWVMGSVGTLGNATRAGECAI